jgi:uncharacterized protein
VKACPFENIDIEGELAVRSGLNFSRLEGKWYRPDEVFTADRHGWPGDWEGRLILGLTLLSRATHRTAAWLEKILVELPGHLNEKGFLGTVHADGRLDEQQLSGHSWLLRALIEYDTWRGHGKFAPLIEAIVRNLFLPARGSYLRYIDELADRDGARTWIFSKLQTKTSAHAETSDCGCAFMPIDGLSQAYEYLKWPELRALVDEMIQVFLSTDLEAHKVQTHATLSAVRGLIRMYETTGERAYLGWAKDRYELYGRTARTAAFGNFNWFGHPRWTEPCGIIDSYIVATGLWAHTGDPRYLEDAHIIYYNALSHGQRHNGSFGTDRCCGAKGVEHVEFLAPVNFETYWCCTMRGGEGFARAIQFTYFLEDRAAYLSFFSPGKARLEFPDGAITIRQTGDYPYDGDIELGILENSCAEAKTLFIFVPSWSAGQGTVVEKDGHELSPRLERGFIPVELEPGLRQVIKVGLGLRLFSERVEGSALVPNLHRFRYGPMILGHRPELSLGKAEADISEEGSDRKLIDFGFQIPPALPLASEARFEALGRGRFKAVNSGMILAPICDVREMTREDSAEQILFQ